MDTLEKAELNTSIRHIAKFLKSGIPVYNSEVLGTAGRRARRLKRSISCNFSQSCYKICGYCGDNNS